MIANRTMNQQLSRTLLECFTSHAPAEVLADAKRFFAQRIGVYSAFFEKEGPTHVVFRGQGGEELIIGVAPVADGTRVTGSTYLFDQQITRFFTSLPPYLVPEAAPALAEGLEDGTPADVTGGGAP